MRRCAQIFVAAVAAVIPVFIWAQSCPVEIESVSPQGHPPATLKITYRATSHFAVRGVKFHAEGVNGGKKPTRPESILVITPLAPGQAASTSWNPARLDKEGGEDAAILLWPALVAMGDGSVWQGSPATCAVTLSKDSPAFTAGSLSDAPAHPTLTAKDVPALVAEGRASIVRITSTPPGATVYVDDYRVGATPITSAILAKKDGGSRSIAVFKAGYTLAGHDVVPNGKRLTTSTTTYSR